MRWLSLLVFVGCRWGGSAGMDGTEPTADGTPDAPVTPAPEPEPDPVTRADLDRAVERAKTCLGKYERMHSDALWLLTRAEPLLAQPEISATLATCRAHLEPDPLAVLLDPDREPFALPARGLDPDQAAVMQLVLDGLGCHWKQPWTPGFKAWIADDAETGYGLTHQVFTVLWAEELGCAPPTGWAQRQDVLLDRVLAEVRGDRGFSDLQAERVALLSLAGRGSQVTEESLAALVASQGADGCWRDPAREVTARMAGREVTLRNVEIHTTALALYAVAVRRAALGAQGTPAPR